MSGRLEDLLNTDDTWVEAGQVVQTHDELREYVAAVRAVVHHMHTGLTRAAWGALQGQAWGDRALEEQPLHEDILEAFSMTITPSGMAAKDAVSDDRQDARPAR